MGKKNGLLLVMLISCLAACAPKEDVSYYIERAERVGEYDGFGVRARQNWMEALDLAVEETGKDSRQTAYILLKIGDSSNNIEEASPYLEESIKLYREFDDLAGMGAASYIYGMKYANQAEPEKALEHFRQAAGYYGQAKGADPMQIYDLYRAMASLTDTQEAMDCYRQCEEVLVRLPEGEQAEKRADTRANIAMVYGREKEYETAAYEYEAAAGLYREAGLEETLTMGELFDDTGLMYLYAGDRENAVRYFEKAVDVYLNLRVNEPYRHIVDISEAYEHLSDATAIGEEPDYERALDYGIRACQYYAGRILKPQDVQVLLRQKEKLRRLYIQVHGESSDFDGWFREQADIWDRKVQQGSYIEPEFLYLSDGDMIFMAEEMSEEIKDGDKILGHIRMAEFDKALQMIGGRLTGCTAKADAQLYNLQGIIYSFQREHGRAAEAFGRARESAKNGGRQAAKVLANNQQAVYTLAKDTGMAAGYAREAAGYAEEDMELYYGAAIEYNRLRMQVLLDLDRMGMLFSPLSVTMKLSLPAALEKKLTGESGIVTKNTSMLWMESYGMDYVGTSLEQVWEKAAEAEPIWPENECHVLADNRLRELKAMYYYCDAGFYEEAKQMELEVLRQKQEIYGVENPAVAESLMNMATICLGGGQYEEAVDYHKRTMDLLKPDSMDAACLYYKLGCFYNKKAAKDKEKAVYYYMAAYKIAERNERESFCKLAMGGLNSLLGSEQTDGKKFLEQLEAFDIQSIELQR